MTRREWIAAAVAAPLGATVGDVPDLAALLGPAPESLRLAIEQYGANSEALRRRYPLGLSARRWDRLRTFDRGWRTAIERIPFDKLTAAGKIEWVLFRNHLDYAVHMATVRERRNAEIASLLPFLDDLLRLEEARRNLEWSEPQQAAALLDRADKRMAELQRQAPEAKPAIAVRAAQATKDLRAALRDWFGFFNGYDPVFTWWIRDPYTRLDKSLAGYGTFLREKVAGIKDRDTIAGDPVGREALVRDLAFEIIPYTPEELIEVARREFAWCDAEMLKASRELGFGEEWKKALEHVKTLGVGPGKQPELIRMLAQEAVDFLEKHSLITIPPLARETWRMRMMTPEQQRINPFFTGGETISVSYPAESMTHEQKMMSMRGNNVHFSRATVFHEVIPGHHLQQFMNARNRPYRSLFRSPFWTEGWALYWEMLLWDMRFHASPADRVGALFWRMHRCARIIFSLSYHMEKMTAAEAVDFLVERVGHERENAAGEVRRSVEDNGYSPLYQCAYMLGALQFRALHRELVGSRKITARQFHDAVLREHAMPVEMVRAAVTGRAPGKDFRPEWRFYEI